MGFFDRFRKRAEPAPVYLDLRKKAINVRRGDLGIDGDQNAPIHGIVMETGVEEGVATFLCLADGTVSLYTSTGGGVIGGGQHESVRAAAIQLVAGMNEFASEYIAACRPDSKHELARRGQVVFILLTSQGSHRAESSERDLAARKHPFANLFANCNVVLTALRESEQRRRG